MKTRQTICGLPVDDLALPAMTEACYTVWERTGSCAVFTPNAAMLASAVRDRGLLALLSACDLSAADGDGLLLAARLCSTPLTCGKVAGVELGKALLYEAARRGIGVYLYGGEPGVAEAAAKRLSEEIPGLRIVGTCHGYGDGEEAAGQIARSGASLTLVCLGFPHQEQWIAAHRGRIGGILAGLGGSLDVYAGRKKRAPRLFRSLRLEWLWRALREPRRFVAVLRVARLLILLALRGKKKATS